MGVQASPVPRASGKRGQSEMATSSPTGRYQCLSEGVLDRLVRVPSASGNQLPFPNDPRSIFWHNVKKTADLFVRLLRTEAAYENLLNGRIGGRESLKGESHVRQRSIDVAYGLLRLLDVRRGCGPFSRSSCCRRG
jgi:hypothetical protein